MAEITLKLDNPAEFARWANAHASQMPSTWVARAEQLYSIASQIEEQVKPAVEEPTEFGSIVRACWPDQPKGIRKLRWQPTPAKGKHYWESEAGLVEVWSELTDVEVLRVGLGNADEDKLAAAFRDGHNEGLGADLEKVREQAWDEGARELAGEIHKRLQQLLDDAITGERKNAFEKAIQAVEELAP